MLILQNKGFHEFVLTILPLSLFSTLMDLLYSAFVSKLFISNDSFIFHLCMLDSFASVFGYSQLKCPWQSLECSVAPNASHFPDMLSFWCSTDRVGTRFFVFPVHPPHPHPHNHNLSCKHCGNCLVIVLVILLLLQSIFFSFAADVIYDLTSCLSKFFSYIGSYNWYPW